MGYGIAPNTSHFTGKKRGKTRNMRKRKSRVRRVHNNKYSG